MNPLDNVDITRKNLVAGLLAVFIAGGLVACKVYHSQQPQLTEIAGAMLIVAAYAWKVPVSAAGTIVTAQRVTVSHADSVMHADSVASAASVPAADPAPAPPISVSVPLGAFAPVKRSHHAAKAPTVAPLETVSDH